MHVLRWVMVLESSSGMTNGAVNKASKIHFLAIFELVQAKDASTLDLLVFSSNSPLNGM